MKCQKISTRSK